MNKYTNPKTLKGQDKINRITDLMGRMSTLNESTSLSEIDFVKKGPNGIVYGIIRENHNYFIKTSEKTSGTLVAEDFEYVGGVQNKYDERYHSYAEALKHLNMKFDMLNESYGIETGTNIFESDGVEVKEANASGLVEIKEEEVGEPEEVASDEDENPEDEKIILDEEPEEVDEQKKVIKVDAPAPPAPVEAPVEDEVEVDPFADEEGMEGEEDPFADEEGMEGEEGMEDEEGDETTKKIQKYTGKVGQLLRDKDEPDPELDKYVINSIVSAIDWEEIPDEDVEDIIAKIEGEDEEDGESDEFATGDEEVVDLDAEEGGEDPFAEEGGEELAESEEEESEEKEEMKESRIFSKKQLMESFLKNTTKKSLKKVLKETHRVCEDCLGEGCESCGQMDEHHNLSDTNYGKYDDDEYVTMFIDEDELDIPERPRRERPERPPIIEPDLNDRYLRPRGLDEDMGPMDAIATGQGYLSATGDLDRDYDGIPNRLDMDADGDSELDFEMGSGDGEGFIELDFDSIMGTETPVKDPDIKEPTTTPGEGDKWRTIKRPKVDPRPKARRDRGDRPRPPKRSFRRKGMFR